MTEEEAKNLMAISEWNALKLCVILGTTLEGLIALGTADKLAVIARLEKHVEGGTVEDGGLALKAFADCLRATLPIN